jgi:phosphoheptose isomerase
MVRRDGQHARRRVRYAPKRYFDRAELERDTVIYLEGLNRTISAINLTQNTRAVEHLIAANRWRGHIYVCGNGGSASTAAHLVSDFNKAASVGVRYGFRCHCLSDNIPMLTALHGCGSGVG